MAIMLAIGSAIIKPDNSGFFPDNQLANAITRAANNTFAKKIIDVILHFSLLFFEMSFGHRKCSGGPNAMPHRLFFNGISFFWSDDHRVEKICITRFYRK